MSDRVHADEDMGKAIIKLVIGVDPNVSIATLFEVIIAIGIACEGDPETFEEYAKTALDNYKQRYKQEVLQ